MLGITHSSIQGDKWRSWQKYTPGLVSRHPKRHFGQQSHSKTGWYKTAHHHELLTKDYIVLFYFIHSRLYTVQWQNAEINTSGRSERDHIVTLVRVRVEASDWFGTPGSVHAGPVCTLITVGPAGTTVAAEGNRVGEHRVGVSGTAGQHGRAVFHLVVGAASLDEEAWTEQVPHVAVLLTAQRHTPRSTVCYCYFKVQSLMLRWF